MERFLTSTREPLFFMHIPKTAGMSMRKYLANQYRPDEIFPDFSFQDLAKSGRSTTGYRLFMGHYRRNFCDLLPTATKKVVVLRDPIRRTLSNLLHLRRDPFFDPSWYSDASAMDLHQIIRDSRIMAMQRNVQTSFLCAQSPGENVVCFLRSAMMRGDVGDPGSLDQNEDLALALDNLDSFQFVGITEEIPDLLARLADGMNFHPAENLSIINEDRSGIDPISELDAEELKILHGYNELDLQLYEYTKKRIRRQKMSLALTRLLKNSIYSIPDGDFEIPLDGCIPGSGFYEAEYSGQKPQRWTGPSNRFSLELILHEDRCYRFEFSAWRQGGIETSDLSAIINDRSSPLERISENLYSVNIHSANLSINGGFCGIEIFTPMAQLARAPDVRMIGVSINELKFSVNSNCSCDQRR